MRHRHALGNKARYLVGASRGIAAFVAMVMGLLRWWYASTYCSSSIEPLAQRVGPGVIVRHLGVVVREVQLEAGRVALDEQEVRCTCHGVGGIMWVVKYDGDGDIVDL